MTLLFLITVLFWATHQAFVVTDSLDPARAGDVPGEERAVLWVNEGLRYRVHVREGAAEPGSCELVTPDGGYPLTFDHTRQGGDAAMVDGYRWFGSFRSPVDGYGAVFCDRSTEMLRVHVDAPGIGWFALLLLAWPLGLLLSAVLAWRLWRRRTAHIRVARPADPPPSVSPAALTAGDRDQTTVYFRNGTLVPAGERDPRAAERFAVKRLTASRAPHDFRTTVTDEGGRLVIFPDLSVHLTPVEIKHSTGPDLGRHALAKIGLDARTPETVHIRPAEKLTAQP